MKQLQAFIKRFSPAQRFWLTAIGLPAGIFVLGASTDALALWKNWRKIKQLNLVINDRQKQKEELTRQVELLKKQDPGAWTQVLRSQAQALLPTEVEYRFKKEGP